MTLRPRYPCVIIKRTKSFDKVGRAEFSTSRRKTKCDVIYIREDVSDTTVREDSSASQGRAEEYVNDVRLLFSPRDNVRLGDVIEVAAFGEREQIKIEVKRVHRRIDVEGRLHHVQVDGDRFASNEVV